MAKAAVFALLVLVACGRHGSTAGAVERKDGGGATGNSDAAAMEISPQPLGVPELEGFRWRKRPGQSAYRKARVAEAKGDWAEVATLCAQALTADPAHLDAAWLGAVALAKMGKTGEVLAPLQRAVCGDFGKWGQQSLEQPGLQPFLATPAGQGWRRRVEADRATYTSALARSLVVMGHRDLYAFDPETTRWYRLTRTSGAVLAALDAPAAHQIGYVTRGKHGVKLGVVDLATGKTLKPVDTGADKLVLTYGTAAQPGFWIGTGTTWRRIDEDGNLHALPAGTKRPPGPWLDVGAHSARLHRLPVANVAADWDDQSLASAIKLATSNRVITAPSPGLVDGNTLAWSPDRSRLAFVTIDDHCTPGSDASSAYVADAATGTVEELERAHDGISVAWLDERRLAIAGDHGVTLVDVTSATKATTPLVGATDLVAQRRHPRCSPDTDQPPDELPDEEAADSGESAGSAEPTVDAGR
jgi:hypothetical protein